jgi:peptidoglycan/LPS O-acetylase OafA/YrhL
VALVTAQHVADSERATSLEYHAPLDGLRGLALLAIITYHAGLPFASGAFLSVSTFFTLSGFLITSLLLAEHARHDAVSLRGFWDRRLRRLMPAALAAITLITVAALWLADATQWLRLRGDALASVFYVANWRFIAQGDTYGAAFESPSPFTHFWTLAIEEQFYLVLPLLVVGALALGRGSRRPVAAVLAGLVVVSVVWSNWLVSSGATVDRLYFGTDVRAPEILAGALMAIWWMRRREPLSEPARRVVRGAGPVALAAMVVLWTTAELTEVAFYRGGLTAYAVLTLIVIASALQPGGLVPRILSWRPLVAAGVLSYAAYLVHYPILIWLEQHTTLGPWPRLLVALPVTFGVAVMSARLLERPFRSGRRPAPGRGGRTLVAGVAGTVAVVLVVTGVFSPVDATDLEQARVWQRYQEQTAAQERSTAPRIALYGDSTALMTGRGLSEISRQRPDDLVAGGGWADLGCGLVTGGSRLVRGEPRPPSDICLPWLDEWRATSAEAPVDVAVVQVGPWEVLDQQLAPDGPYLTVGEDPELDAAIAANLRRGIETLLVDNGMVAVLSPPDVEYGRVDGRPPAEPLPESDPARMAAVRAIIDDVAASYGDRVAVVDLAGWVAAHPDDGALRRDGVHFTDDSTVEVARWLGPELVELHVARTGRTETLVVAGD